MNNIYIVYNIVDDLRRDRLYRTRHFISWHLYPFYLCLLTLSPVGWIILFFVFVLILLKWFLSSDDELLSPTTTDVCIAPLSSLSVFLFLVCGLHWLSSVGWSGLVGWLIDCLVRSEPRAVCEVREVMWVVVYVANTKTPAYDSNKSLRFCLSLSLSGCCYLFVSLNHFLNSVGVPLILYVNALLNKERVCAQTLA